MAALVADGAAVPSWRSAPGTYDAATLYILWTPDFDGVARRARAGLNPRLWTETRRPDGALMFARTDSPPFESLFALLARPNPFGTPRAYKLTLRPYPGHVLAATSAPRPDPSVAP